MTAAPTVRGLEPQAHEVGVGVIGVAGGNFIDAPEDQSITIGGRSGSPVNMPDYPGFSGAAYGLGLAVDVRLFGYGGVELDIVRSRDTGRADFVVPRTGATSRFTVELSHDAWHVPLLLKAALPTPVARPTVFLGPEFVFAGGAEAEVTEGVNLLDTQLSAMAESYTMFTWGAGVEVELPIPSVDVRVAATARGSFNPGVADERMDRARYAGPDIHRLRSVSYKTTWQYQMVGTLMAGIYF